MSAFGYLCLGALIGTFVGFALFLLVVGIVGWAAERSK